MKTTFFTFVVLVFMTASLHGQHINNTLGSLGTFTIKDGSTTFLQLDQADGNLDLFRSLTLPVSTSSSLGVVFKGANRFLHDFQAASTIGQNTFVGVGAGNFSMSRVTDIYDASHNTGLGFNVLSDLTTGFQNSAFGNQAASSVTTGSNNTAAGNMSLMSTTSGTDNSAFGASSMDANTTGFSNSAFGAGALGSATTANGNSAFGVNAMGVSTSGNGNSSFGQNSLINNAGNYNAAFGHNALQNNSSDYNSAFGYYALVSNTSGAVNSAFGRQALFSNTTGGDNCAFGNFALSQNSTGNSNVAFGNAALTAASNHYNSAFGYSAGSTVSTGSNLTLLGYNAQPSSSTTSNEITLGNNSVTLLRCQVTEITALSDVRDKKNIRDLSLGLDFLMSIQPRQFNWDQRSWYGNDQQDGSKMKENPTAGFIAQELDKAQTAANAEWLNLVLKSNPDRLEATPGNLLPIMVKAIQELKAENDALRRELEEEKVKAEGEMKEQIRREVRKVLSETGGSVGRVTTTSLID